MGGRARLGPRLHEGFSPRAPDNFANWAGFRAAAAAPKAEMERLPASGPCLDWQDVSGVPAPAPRGFDMAAIRPGEERLRRKVERPPLAGGWSWGVVFSLGLHVAALTALLLWATPVAETPPPEPVTVEIVVDAPAPAISEAPSHPAALAEAPLQPVEEQSAPVPAPPIEPPATTVEPPQIAEAPPTPQPPVVEPTPAPETPPPPLEETPAPALATMEPAPAAEAPPPAPPPQPGPVASPATPPVLKPAPPAPAKARLAPPHGARTRAAPESAPAASKSTKPAPTARQAAAPVVSSAESAAYRSAVLGRIAARKRYPEAARERASHGVAVVSFSLSASGQVAVASISESAGDPILDAEALATIRRASPFPPPPAGTPRNFSAALSYRVR